MPPIFWVQKQDIGPSPRTDPAMAFDAARRRVVLFGGDPGGTTLGDTWSWDGNLWTQVGDIGPSPRRGPSLTDAPFSQRLVLFGGANGAAFLGDTWTFDGVEWTQVAGTGPAPRGGHAAAYDAVQGFVVLFGGFNGTRLGDTWLWGAQGWTQVQDVGPSPRRGHAMGFDPARNQVVLFGGAGEDGVGLGDTWAWDGSNWTQVADTGPEPRAGASMAAGASTVLFGGVNSFDLALAPADRVVYGDTWELDAQGWSKVQDIGPDARYDHGAAARSDVGKIVLFGGTSTFGIPEDPALQAGLRYDTWEVPVGTAGSGTTQPGGGTTQPVVNLVGVAVAPSIIPAMGVMPGMAVASVTVTFAGAPPAGEQLQIDYVVQQVGWYPANPAPFNDPMYVFDGATSSVTFPLISTGVQLSSGGTYGVRVTYGPLQLVAAVTIS